MRTTLSLDDDVAAMIEKLREERKAGLKEIVNQALREGLPKLSEPKPARVPYKTNPIHTGKCYFSNLDNIHETLEEIEGHWYK